MKKKNWRLRRQTVFSRDTCWWPTRPHYLSKPGGEGGGGLGGVAYKDRARPLPRANNNNAHSITKYGVLGRLDVPIVVLHVHCA